MLPDLPRLFLITPPIAAAGTFVSTLEAAMAPAVACVLLRIATPDHGDAKTIVRTLAPLAQKHGAACLVETDLQLAVRGEADGVHVNGTGDALDAALQALKPHRIVGVGGLATRDAAMEAGEAEVDYLMFGGPDHAMRQADVLARVAWWAEIFTVPCVGFVDSLAAIEDMVRAGADFVAVGDAVWSDPRGAGAAIDTAVRAVAAAVPEAAR